MFVILSLNSRLFMLLDDILKDHYSLKTGGLSAGMTHLCTKYKIECRTIYGLTKFISNYLPDHNFESDLQTSRERDSWNIVKVDNQSYFIDLDRGATYDSDFRECHRPFFMANTYQFFWSHYPECICKATTLLRLVFSFILTKSLYYTDTRPILENKSQWWRYRRGYPWMAAKSISLSIILFNGNEGKTG